MFVKSRQILFVLIIAAPATASVDAATITNADNITMISGLGTLGSWPFGQTYFSHDQTEEHLDHGVFMSVSGSYDIDLGPNTEEFRASHSIHSHGSAKTQTAIGISSGQVGVLTSGVVIRASALYSGARYLQNFASLSARNRVSLTFDEPVNVRVEYQMGRHGGQGSVNNLSFQPGDSGVLNFVSSTLDFDASVGTSTYVEVDGYPDEDTVLDFPSSDTASTPIETTMFRWAISPLDQQPVLPGKGPDIPIGITIIPTVDPSGGFDPIPIGTQDMLASSEPTFIGIGTKVVSDIIEGTIFESIEVKSIDNPFTSLLLSDLPVGSNLTVTFGGLTHNVVAGEPIDFGAGGVESFVLAGLDPAHSSTAQDALVFGLGFAETGWTSIQVLPTNTYHASDINLDSIVDTADYIVWRKHLGTTSGAMHWQGDANGDAAVDAEDYTLWRKQYSKLANNGASLQLTSVPEPRASILFVSMMLGVIPFGRRSLRQHGWFR